MRGKRAKQLRKFADKHGVKYRLVKKAYKILKREGKKMNLEDVE